MANQPKKYKKFVATAATATLVASAIVPVASAAHEDTAGHQFESYIKEATELGLFQDGGEFKPQGTLTRKHVVLILGRYLEKAGFKPLADYATNPAFSDLGTTDAEYIRLASVVKEAGVFGGDGGKLNGSNPIKREQMAKVLDGLSKAVTGISLVEAAKDIEDVEVSDLDTAQAGYRDQIQALADFEITTVSTFNPKGNVNRGQFAKFIMTTIGAIEDIKEGIKPTPEKVQEVLKAVEDAVKALPVLASITKENAADASAKAAAVNAAVAAAEKVLAKADLTDVEKVEAQKAVDAAKAAAKAVTDQVAEVTKPVVGLAVESVSAINAKQIEVKFSDAVREADLFTTVDAGTFLKADFISVNKVSNTVEPTASVDKDNKLENLKASLSSDGKTLTITLGATASALVQSDVSNGQWTWNGTNIVEILPGAKIDVNNKVGTQQLPGFKAQFIFNDTVRPDVKEVTYPNANTARIWFTEPVMAVEDTATATKALFTAKYTDASKPAITIGTGSTGATAGTGTVSPTADDKHVVNTEFTAPASYIDVDLSDKDILANEDITVTVGALKDVNGNTASPKVVKIKKSTDTVKPTVSSVTIKSIKQTTASAFTTTVDVKFSEAIKFPGAAGTADLTKFSIAGTAPTSATILPDGQTVRFVVAKKVVGNTEIDIAEGAVIDLVGNKLDDYGVVHTLTHETAAPTVVAQRVAHNQSTGVKSLILTYGEEIALNALSAANIKVTFAWVNDYGVNQKLETTLDELAKVTATKPKQVAAYDLNKKGQEVAITLNAPITGSLNGAASAATSLPENKTIQLTIDQGFAFDNFNTPSAKVENRTFNIGEVSEIGTGAVQIAKVFRASNKDYFPGGVFTDATPASGFVLGAVDVVFAGGAVDPTAAKNVANYSVEGATIKEVLLLKNDGNGAQVRLVLADDTVKVSGNYNVNVKGIKTMGSATATNAVKDVVTYLPENVLPVTTAVAVDTLTAEDLKVRFTFAEDIAVHAAGTKDFALVVNGVTVTTVEADALVTAGKVLALTFKDGSNAVPDLTTATSIALVVLEGTDIVDAAGNKVKAGTVYKVK